MVYYLNFIIMEELMGLNIQQLIIQNQFTQEIICMWRGVWIIMFLGVGLLEATPPKLEREVLVITHSNDINLLGETSGNRFADDGFTGLLQLRYQSKQHAYEVQLNSYTQRHQSQGERVDTLSLAYF